MSKINPASKIIMLFVFITCVLIGDSVANYFRALLILVMIITLTKISLKKILIPLYYVTLFSTIMLVYNILFIKVGTIIYIFGFIEVHSFALEYTFSIYFRMVLVVLATTILLNIVSTYEFIEGLKYILKPLKVVGVNIEKFGTVVKIAITFVPILKKEISRTMKAHAAKGLDYRNKFSIGRILYTTRLILPVLVTSLNKADELAVAMDIKGYCADTKRSNYYQLKMDVYNILFIIIGSLITYIFIIYW